MHLSKCTHSNSISSVVKNLSTNAGDEGLIPGQGTKIPQTTLYSQKKKKPLQL